MRVVITSFEAAEPDIRKVRDAVFGAEQGVPPELDWDGKDPECLQVVAYDDAGEPVGTGRLGSDGRIGRVAVVAAQRRRGVGAGLMEALVNAARENGASRVYLHSQTAVREFYEELGFVGSGEIFHEAEIPHIYMERAL